MKHPFELMEAVHKICEEELIPKGISPEHPLTTHEMTTTLYYRSLNRAGYGETPASEVAEAIIKATGWDRNSPWPGHPDPDKVIAILKHG